MSNNVVAVSSCTTGSAICIGQYFSDAIGFFSMSEWMLILGLVSSIIGIATAVSALMVNIKRYQYHSNRIAHLKKYPNNVDSDSEGEDS